MTSTTSAAPPPKAPGPPSAESRLYATLGLTIVAPSPADSYALWDPQAAACAPWRDANNECKHGRLAGDPTPDCGCHTPLPTAAPTAQPIAVPSRRDDGHTRRHRRGAPDAAQGSLLDLLGSPS